MTKDIKKEFLYSLRASRLLIITAAFLFLAVLTPLMTKMVMPSLLRSQFPDMTEDLLSQMLNMTQLGSIQGFFNDIFEMGLLIVCFTLCGLTAQELKENTLVIPLCSGKHFSRIVMAKFMVFGLILVSATLAGASTNYFYAGMLFEFQVGYQSVLLAAALQSIYLIFILACILFFGSISKKPIATGVITIVMAYGLQAVGGLLDITKWLPAGLISQAQQVDGRLSSDGLLSLAVTAAATVVLMLLTVWRLENMELNDR